MNVKLHLVKTTNTATIGSQTEYGVHRKCKPRLHVKRTRKVVDSAAE